MWNVQIIDGLGYLEARKDCPRIFSLGQPVPHLSLLRKIAQFLYLTGNIKFFSTLIILYGIQLLQKSEK
jgi:hypothetical protein